MKKKEIISYLIIFLFTITYFCFINGDVYLIADDTIFHTSNIMVMADNISWNNLIPGKILPNLVNNLGYGVNIFYPGLPHIMASYIYKIFSLFNLGIESVMKFIHFIVIYLSGIFMYKYIKTVFKNKRQALLSSIIYLSMPYLFTDIFMRGAFNEGFIFIYLPMIFLSMYYLFESDEKSKFYFWFILGYSLFISSHLVLSIYLTIFLIIFMLVYYRKLFSKKIISKLVIASTLVLLITSNFWAPLVEHYLLDNYYIFSLKYDGIHKSVEVVNILHYLLPLRLRYITSKPGYFLSFNIAPIALLLIGCCIVMFRQKKIDERYKKILKGFSLFLVIALLFASSSLLWKVIPNLLRNIQFSWRIAIFIAFASSVIAGYGIRLFKEKLKKWIVVFAICLGGVSNFVLSANLNYIDVEKIDFLKNSCCYLQWSYEYLPVDSIERTGNLTSKREELGLWAINKTKIIKNNVPNMEFIAFNIDNNVVVEFPRIYYLGYELRHEDGEVIEVYQNDYGLIEAIIKRDGTYYLEYKGTLIDRITKVLSVITIIGSISYIIVISIKKKKNLS